jgi:hypothetical protein
MGVHPHGRDLGPQGPKLTPTGQADQGALGAVEDWSGYSVALSSDGETALVGGSYDDNGHGAPLALPGCSRTCPPGRPPGLIGPGPRRARS